MLPGGSISFDPLQEQISQYMAQMTLPQAAELCEVGPRDGFQFEAMPIATDVKVEVIEALVDAGLKRIQVTSFVHPKKVPQMADAEEVVRALGRREEVILSGLVLNLRGLERAAAAGLEYVDISAATNEQHGRDNVNMSVEQALEEAVEMAKQALEHGMRPQVGLQTVFGYAAPGDTPVEVVLDAIERFADLDLDSLSLADSTGMANPRMIEEKLGQFLRIVDVDRLVLHLHDTRGLGMSNVVTALRCGVHRFDTSVGGMGGCPFIPGATGNIATEDTVYLLESLGVSTGVSLEKVAACSLRLEKLLGRPLPGRLHSLVGKSVGRS